MPCGRIQGYNSIRETDSVASSIYNSFQLNWNRRFTAGLMIGLSFLDSPGRWFACRRPTGLRRIPWIEIRPRGETGGTEPFILHVRTRNRPDAIIRPVESALRAIDSRLPFFEIHTLAEGCRPSRSWIRPGGLFRSVLRWGRCDRYATRFGEHLRSVILDAPFASSRSPDGSWVKIFHERC
jgi:hypothetical protein